MHVAVEKHCIWQDQLGQPSAVGSADIGRQRFDAHLDGTCTAWIDCVLHEWIVHGLWIVFLYAVTVRLSDGTYVFASACVIVFDRPAGWTIPGLT